MSTGKRVLIGLAVLLVLALVVGGSLRGGGGTKGTKVYTETAERSGITKVVKASGVIDPRVKVNISAHVIGKIEHLYVDEGQEITAGAPFLQLEREAFVAARDNWAAQLRQARTSVRQAEVNLADAQVKLDRATRLVGEGIYTSEQLETAQLSSSSAELALEQQKQIVEQTRANLVKAEDDLRKTTIYSPLSGRIIALNAEEGEVVVSGTMNNPASVIGTVADLSEILADVDVDETEIVNVHLGQSADLKVDAVPDTLYHGSVVEIASSGFSRPSQPDVTFFKVKVLLSNADESLRPSMSVRAEIETARNAEALVVPIQAVLDREPVDGAPDSAQSTGDRADDNGSDEIPVVFTIEEGVARQMPVTTGLTSTTEVEITSGLEEGQQILTGPYRSLKNLKDGDAVQVDDDQGADKSGDDEDED